MLVDALNKPNVWLTLLKGSHKEDGVSLLKEFSFNERFALAAVVLLHLAVVVPLAATLNIWIDEAYTLQSTSNGLAYAVQRALNFELQPPLYYLVLTFWRKLDDSLFFARLFSICCTTSTIVVVGGLAKRFLPGVPAVLVAAVVAFNPFTVYVAIEARPYALALVLSALLILLFHDGYIAVHPSAAARRRYTVMAAVALYTHYFLGFILTAGGAILVLIRQSAALRKYLVGMAITTILFIPIMIMVPHQMVSIHSTGVRSLTFIAGVKLVWNAAWDYMLPVSEDSPLAVLCRWVSRLALPLGLLTVLIRRRRPTAELWALFILTAVISLSFVVVAIRLGTEFMLLRHTTVLFLPILLVAMAALQYAGGVRAMMIGALASLLFAGPYLAETYAPLARSGDWMRVSRYIEQYEETSEPILVFKAEFTLALRYHYIGHNRLIPLPRPPNEEHFDQIIQVINSESQILEALSGRIGVARRFWLVTSSTKPFRGVDFHPEILEEFIARYCTVLQDKSFLKSRVRRLELRSEVATKLSYSYD